MPLFEPVEVPNPALFKGIVGIYAIIHAPTCKLYIGSSVNVGKRLYWHRSQLRKGAHDNSYLQRAWNCHGESEFRFFCVWVCSIDELLMWESIWMSMTACASRDIGFNLDQLAVRKLHSEETKAKIRAANKGRPKTEEHKAKLSKGRLGTKLSQPRSLASRENYRRARLGWKWPAEAIANMRKGQQRRRARGTLPLPGF